jgi:hypothetical protein
MYKEVLGFTGTVVGSQVAVADSLAAAVAGSPDQGSQAAEGGSPVVHNPIQHMPSISIPVGI